MSTALEQMTQGQLDVLSAALARAKEEIDQAGLHEKTRLAKTLAVVFENCLEIPKGLERLWDSVVDLMNAGLLSESERANLLQSFEKGDELLSRLSDLLGFAQEHGVPVQRGNALAGAKQRIADLNQAAQQHFDALAQLQRGECLGIDDAFAQIAGVDKNAWLARVQEHKQTARK